MNMNDDSISPEEYNPQHSSTNDNGSTQHGQIDGSDAPKPKRIACVICRKRKLRCDGTKPSCGTCSRLGHSCAYDEVRRKSGPKRGYVKALEARLAQVETLLTKSDGTDEPANAPDAVDLDDLFAANKAANATKITGVTFPVRDTLTKTPNINEPSIPGMYPSENQRIAQDAPIAQISLKDQFLKYQTGPVDSNGQSNGSYNWDIIGLGVEEPLPPQDVQDDLYRLYFEKSYPAIPIIHRARFLSSLNHAPHMRPPVPLRYIIWAVAASTTERYREFQYHFYTRARKYLEEIEMRNFGEVMVKLGIVQAWALVAGYEFSLMYFPRAWVSVGRALRLAQMCGLQRLDETGLDVKVTLPPPKDWSEREERSRTFWHVFCMDRCASMGTGWPMSVDEKDIMTHLPASDRSFEDNIKEPVISLKDARSPQGAKNLSPFAAVMVMASCFGHNLHHLHRSDPGDRDDDVNGAFWKRHRQMDSMLLNISLSLPSHLRLPINVNDQKIVFTNMCIHTVTICLHQAAIFKAELNNLPSSISVESKIRCVTAAAEIASIMRMISHVDLTNLHPYIPFSLYVAARVFVQYLKGRPDDDQANSSLRFLLTAMNVMKQKNPITESFLIQLDVDMEGRLDSFACINSSGPSWKQSSNLFESKDSAIFPPYQNYATGSNPQNFHAHRKQFESYGDLADLQPRKMEGLQTRIRSVASPTSGSSPIDCSGGDNSSSSATGSQYPTPQDSGQQPLYPGTNAGVNSPFSLLEQLMGTVATPGPIPVALDLSEFPPMNPAMAKLPVAHIHDYLFSATIPPSEKGCNPQSNFIPSPATDMPPDFGVAQTPGGGIDFGMGQNDMLAGFGGENGEVDMGMGMDLGRDDFAMMSEMLAMGWAAPGNTGLTLGPMMQFDENGIAFGDERRRK